MTQLLWRDAQGIEGTVALSGAEVRVGRAMDCVIRSDDAMVSRHHARVFWGGGGYVLEDLDSANGVYFQEQRVKSHLFKHGDAIRCGSLWLRYIDETGAGAGAPVPEMPPPPQQNVPGGISAASYTPPQNVLAPPPAPAPPAAAANATASADIEIRVLRRRLEQMQTELRVFRSNKFSADTVNKLEDLENDLVSIEVERDSLRHKVSELELVMATESGSIKVKRALEIAGKTAETAALLTDLLSSVRIEVMAASGEFDQFAQQVPRASFELIRQSLLDAAENVEKARQQLRTLRELSE